MFSYSVFGITILQKKKVYDVKVNHRKIYSLRVRFLKITI